MKVLVSYSSDLKDIPSVVSDMLKNLKNRECEDVFNMIDLSSEQCESLDLESLETIDKLRKILAKMDERLLDCASIMAGYAKTNADLHLGVDPSEPQEERDENAKPSEETND